MTPDYASILFDAMDKARKARVRERCLLILTAGEPIRSAFAQAVDDEASAIEREMLAEQPTDGAA